MGCFASEEQVRNNAVSTEVRHDAQTHARRRKILFLGSGGSGKSTIFKQLRTIYNRPFTPGEIENFRRHIHTQVVTQMRSALDVLEQYASEDDEGELRQNIALYIDKKRADSKQSDDDDDDDDDEDEYDEFGMDDHSLQLSKDGKQAQAFMNARVFETGGRLTDDVAQNLRILWHEPAIKKMFAMRNVTKIEDSSAYFWDKLDQLKASDYRPDEADIVLVRHRTTGGAIEQKFETPNGKGFSIIDVGGQKSERKKWVHCFSGVTAVIFVASLSCYDEVLFEDLSVNSMTDQLQLFDSVCNNPHFSKTSMILFLNKQDIFRDKIQRASIRKCAALKYFEGDSASFEETTTYVRKAFESLNRDPSKKAIFTHLTCATEQNNIQTVFADVQQIVIESALLSTGLLEPGGDDNVHGSAARKQEHLHDQATADKIRSVIKKSTRHQQTQKHAHAHTHTHAASAKPKYNFRELLVKKQRLPHVDDIEYQSVLAQYEYRLREDKNVMRVTLDQREYMQCHYCWAQCRASPFLTHTRSRAKPPKTQLQKTKLRDTDSEAELETFLLLSIEGNEAVQSQVSRKKLNVCVLIDTTPSMSHALESTRTNMSKLAAVQESLLAMLPLLRGDDRVAVITYDEQYAVAQELALVATVDVEALSQRIRTLECSSSSGGGGGGGGRRTRGASDAYMAALTQFQKLFSGSGGGNKEYANRIVMLTSAPLPDTILSNATEMAAQDVAPKRVYSSFIGVAQHFLSQKDEMRRIRGCNFACVESAAQLYETLVTRLSALVTPLMFNLSVSLKKVQIANVWRINHDHDDNRDYRYSKSKHKQHILQLDTVFLQAGQRRDLLLVKLVHVDDASDHAISVKTTFQDDSHTQQLIPKNAEFLLQKTPTRANSNSADDHDECKEDALLNGKVEQQTLVAHAAEDYFDNASIRKAVLLSRYVHLVREWTRVMSSKSSNREEMTHKLQAFMEYFKTEARAIDDDPQLQQEINVLQSMLTINR